MPDDANEPRMWEFGEWRLDRHNKEIVALSGEKKGLSVIEFGVLDFLIVHHHDLYDQKQIMRAVWKIIVDTNAVEQQLTSIRKKLRALHLDPDQIIGGERGKGYRFLLTPRNASTQIVFPDKAELYRYVDQLLAQNKIIHDDLGPRSYVAKQHPLSNMQTLWETQKQEQIIPNNARIVAAFHRHRPFVSVEEWSVFSRFQAHVTAFAASAEGTLDSVPLFPIEFAHMVGRKEGSKKEKEQPVEPTLAQLDIFTSTMMKHKKVKDFELIDDLDFPEDQVYKIRRVDKLGTVTVYVTNQYVIGHAELLEIITVCPEINCIVSMSRWNHYTDEAKGYAVRNKVGLFMFGEFLGALHWKRFWQYEPPEPPEPPKDKNKW